MVTMYGVNVWYHCRSTAVPVQLVLVNVPYGGGYKDEEASTTEYSCTVLPVV